MPLPSLQQTTLRSVVGQMELDELLAQREKIISSSRISWINTRSHGESKFLWLKQNRSIYLKRCEGLSPGRRKLREKEEPRSFTPRVNSRPLKKLAQAAKVISVNPAALQLRFLQTLTEVATEKNSTTIFPVPIDLLKPFLKKE